MRLLFVEAEFCGVFWICGQSPAVVVNENENKEDQTEHNKRSHVGNEPRAACKHGTKKGEKTTRVKISEIGIRTVQESGSPQRFR